MRAQLARDFDRFRAGLPPDFPAYVRETYRIDLSGRYLGAYMEAQLKPEAERRLAERERTPDRVLETAMPFDYGRA